jgi:hypothetical protein
MNEIIDILDELDITISDEVEEAIEETPEDMFNLLLDNILEQSNQRSNQMETKKYLKKLRKIDREVSASLNIKDDGKRLEAWQRLVGFKACQAGVPTEIIDAYIDIDNNKVF